MKRKMMGKKKRRKKKKRNTKVLEMRKENLMGRENPLRKAKFSKEPGKTAKNMEISLLPILISKENTKESLGMTKKKEDLL